ncbi:MAG: hypothetical protein ACXV7D_11695 [Thermoanaerobaculia bacterium]
MNAIVHLLELFYDRMQPISVAFVGSAKFSASFGRRVTESGSSSFEGSLQWHSEDAGLSTYSSYFGFGKTLVVQFDFHDDAPNLREWNAFVRLAALIQRYLDDPMDFLQLPEGGAPVRQPRPSSPPMRHLSAEAPLEDV